MLWFDWVWIYKCYLNRIEFLDYVLIEYINVYVLHNFNLVKLNRKLQPLARWYFLRICSNKIMIIWQIYTCNYVYVKFQRNLEKMINFILVSKITDISSKHVHTTLENQSAILFFIAIVHVHVYKLFDRIIVSHIVSCICYQE